MFDRPLFPLALDLRDRVCVVIARSGDGDVRGRLDALAECGADARLVNSEDFAREALAGAFFVLSLVRDETFSRELDACAREAGFLLWCIDQPGYGAVSMMAVAKAGRVRVATSTSGAAPAISSAFRKGLERAMGTKFESFISRMALFRAAIRERHPAAEDAAVRIDTMTAIATGFWVDVSIRYPQWFEQDYSGGISGNGRSPARVRRAFNDGIERA